MSKLLKEKEKLDAMFAQLVYLPKPPDAKRLKEYLDYYLNDENRIPEKDRAVFVEALKVIKSQEELITSEIVGYYDDKLTGFTALALKTPSGDGVVSFKGSEDVKALKNFEDMNKFGAAAADWSNNIIMQLTPTSQQEIMTTAFMLDKKNGAGTLENIHTVGHSLGGYLAWKTALLDSRVNSASVYNAPGDLNLQKITGDLMPNGTKKNIKAFAVDGDATPKIGYKPFKQTMIPNKDGYNTHGLGNFFMEGEERMEINEALENIDTQINTKSLAEAITDMWTAVQEKSKEACGELVTGIGNWATEMVAKAEEEVPKFIESVVTYISELPGKAGEFFDALITDIGTWISGMCNYPQLGASFALCVRGIGCITQGLGVVCGKERTKNMIMRNNL